MRDKIFLTLLLVFISTIGYSQACKEVKKGMSQKEVIMRLGEANKKLIFLEGEIEMSEWKYGSQEVVFINSLVETVRVHFESDSTMLRMDLNEGRISEAVYKTQFEKLKSESCK